MVTSDTLVLYQYHEAGKIKEGGRGGGLGVIAQTKETIFGVCRAVSISPPPSCRAVNIESTNLPDLRHWEVRAPQRLGNKTKHCQRHNGPEGWVLLQK